MKIAYKDCIWTGPYVVVKALSNNIKVVRRTCTRYTQTLHRFRLRLYAPNQRVPDVTIRREDFLPDPDVKTTHNDWYAQAWATEFGEVLFGTPTENSIEEAKITEFADKTKDDATTTKNEVAKTAKIESSDGDKISSDNVTSFNLDVSDNAYNFTPPPIVSPPKTPELPPIVVGYNPRKIGRYNLRPNPKPNANPDFRLLDFVTTEDSRQNHT